MSTTINDVECPECFAAGEAAATEEAMTGKRASNPYPGSTAKGRDWYLGFCHGLEQCSLQPA